MFSLISLILSYTNHSHADTVNFTNQFN